MKNLLALLVCVLILTITQAQITVTLEPFTKILIKGNLDVELIPSEQFSLEIERGENDRVTFAQEDGLLTIKHKEILKYKSYRDFPIQIKIGYNELSKLDARAGAMVKSLASISGIRLDVHLGSGAKLEADLQLQKADVDVAEGSKASLTGRVGRFTAIASSGGQLEAFDLASEDSRIRANTGGVAQISVFKSLDAQANTGGCINYKGNPEELVINEELWGNISENK